MERNKLDAQALRIFKLGTDRGIDLAQAIEAGFKSWSCTPEYRVLVPTTVVGHPAADIVGKASDTFGGEGLPLALDADGRLCIGSHLDVLITDPLIDGHCSVVEIKTKGSYGFKKLADEGIDASYQMQVRGHVRGLQHEGLVVDDCFVLYENKDSQLLRAEPLDLDDEYEWGLYDQSIARISHLLLSWAGGGDIDQAPAVYAEGKSAGALPWQCNYCSVGPVKGRCANPAKLVNEKPNARIPKWRVT